MASVLEGLLAQNQPHLATHSALLIVGLQNDFISPDGQLPVTTSLEFLKRIRRLIPAFRVFAGDVIWVKTVFQGERIVNDGMEDSCMVVLDIDGTEDRGSMTDEESIEDLVARELAAHPSSKPLRQTRSMRAMNLFKRVSARSSNKDKESLRSSKASMTSVSTLPLPPEEDELFLSRTSKRAPCCLPKTFGAGMSDQISDLVDMSKDVMLIKSHYSAFNATSLLQTLRTKLITELYICGCMTNLSVYATALDAARHGLTINIIEDCLGYRKIARHEEALKQMTQIMGAYSVTSHDIHADLSSPPDDRRRNELADAEHELANMIGRMKVEDDRVKENSRTRTTGGNKAETSEYKAKFDVAEVMPWEAMPDNATPTVMDDSGSSESVDELKDLVARRMAHAMSPLDGNDKKYVKQKVRMRQRSSRPGDTLKENAEENWTRAPTPYRNRSPPPREDDRPWEKVIPVHEPQQPFPDFKPLRPLKPPPSQEPPQPPSRKPLPEKAQLSLFPPPVTTPVRQPAPPKEVSSQGSVRNGKMKKKNQQTLATFPTMGPGDEVGEGDSYIVYDLLDDDRTDPDGIQSDQAFHLLYNEVRWQKMHHAQGQVPRLVAVQGEIGSDGSMPVYRHPSDQSPPLLHFSPTVQMIRERVEETIDHPVNHVLIQLYRSGQDFISEHSDKTLDIVRGSSIVNVSFGAQRTMRIRTKKSAAVSSPQQSDDPTTASSRTTQRIVMPHNSMFVLGQDTNMRWLHGISADKRPPSERSDAEKACEGMRISLTFRHIGTFLSPNNSLIWGQGATSKEQQSAASVINNDEKETEDMIYAFGTENHSTEFDWAHVYGKGFDVLHFREPPEDIPVLFSCDNEVENEQVLVYLKYLGLKHSVPDGPPPLPVSLESKRGMTKPRQLTFRDTDAHHTEVHGAPAILLYLDRFHSALTARARTTSALAYALLPKYLHLQTAPPGKESIIANGSLELFEQALASSTGPFLCGEELSIVDALLIPLLERISPTKVPPSMKDYAERAEEYGEV